MTLKVSVGKSLRRGAKPKVGETEEPHHSDRSKLPRVNPGGNASWGKNTDEEKRLLKCFICDGPHMARDYPVKSKFVALVKAGEKVEER